MGKDATRRLCGARLFFDSKHGCVAWKRALRCRFPTLDSDMVQEEFITRHFFNGFIRLHLLYHAAKEPVFGGEIAEELTRHGYRLSQGTLYPTLHLLEKRGYLTSHVEFVRGKRRRYYAATSAGRKVLRAARAKIKELVAEVIEGQDESFRAIQEKKSGPRKSAANSRKRGSES